MWWFRVFAEGRAAVVAEHLGVPLVLVHTVPGAPDRCCAVPGAAGTTPRLSRSELPGLDGRRTSPSVQGEARAKRLATTTGLATTRKPTARRCADQGALELQAYSPALVPGHGRWPSRRPVIGALELGAEERHRLGERLAADLDAWLADGEAPAYFGFGSMSVPGPQRVLDMVARVSASLGMRASSAPDLAASPVLHAAAATSGWWSGRSTTTSCYQGAALPCTTAGQEPQARSPAPGSLRWSVRS